MKGKNIRGLESKLLHINQAIENSESYNQILSAWHALNNERGKNGVITVNTLSGDECSELGVLDNKSIVSFIIADLKKLTELEKQGIQTS